MSNPDEIRARIEQTRSSLGTDVDALADKVSPTQIAERQKDKVRSGFTSVKESVMGGVHSATDGVKDAAASTRDGSGDAASGAKRAATGHPLVVGLIAFGAGWLLSSLLPASETEQQLASSAKQKAAPLTDKVGEVAKSAGQEIAQNLQEPAQQAAQHVKGTATDAAQTVKEEGRSAADDVKSSAADAKGIVQEQAAGAKDDVRGAADAARS